MKHILFLILALPLFLSLTSCTPNDQYESNINPIKGTLWSTEDENGLGEKYTRYIEFYDDKNVKMWDTYRPSKISNGTYIVTGNKITFSNLYNSYDDEYTEGTFTSHSLTVSYYYIEGHKLTETYTKE